MSVVIPSTPSAQAAGVHDGPVDLTMDMNNTAEIFEDRDDRLEKVALISLALQHLSSCLSYRAAEFVYSLFFVTVFTNSLLPASLYGFVTTGSAIVWSGTVGSLTDKYKTHRLRTVRVFILSQKILVIASYSLFFVLFSSGSLLRNAENGGHGVDPKSPANADVWTIFAALTFLGCLLVLSNVGVSVTIERDWATSIAQGSSKRLARLNAILRRIDLICKLVAPLLVSLLTTTISLSRTCIVLMTLSAATMCLEAFLIGVVFSRFSILRDEQHLLLVAKEQKSISMNKHANRLESRAGACEKYRRMIMEIFTLWLTRQYNDWRTFAVMPIFISSISISMLYMSVLSFDSTFIAYLKSETTYSDAFIAGMRGICVLTGLFGTFVSPFLTARIGFVRTGTWSLLSELFPLIMTIISLYKGANVRTRPAWNTALLFLGLALSRIGLWSFDLAQLAQVQTALTTHPRRNALMGLQFALQNALDLLHYALTIIWSKPEEFRNAADFSFAAITLATAVYILLYARRERGHIIHLDKIGIQALLGRKNL